MGIEETEGFTSAREELLKEHYSSKAGQLFNRTPCLLGSCHQLRYNSALLTPGPGLCGFDNCWQPDLTHCCPHFTHIPDNDATRNSQTELPGNFQCLLFIDGYA